MSNTIQAKDLRIGNCVQVFKTHYYKNNISVEPYDAYEIVVVEYIFPEGINLISGAGNTDEVEYEIERVEPIPITEQWLLDFGFRKMITQEDCYLIPMDKEFTVDSEDFILSLKNNLCYTELGFGTFPISFNKTEYVHQLQTLYFAITGEELTLSQ